MARTQQTARKPKNKKQQKKAENASEGEENTAEKQEDEIKEEESDEHEVESTEEDNNEEIEEITETEQIKEEEEDKETTEENKENSDNTDFHKARRTLYIHFPPGPIGESGMEMLDNVYQNNGKLVLPQLVCFAAFPSEEVVESIKPKLEELELDGKPLAVKFMGAKGTDMDDPCINPFRIKVQGLLVHPDEKQVAKKFPAGKITQTIKKLKSVTLDFNTKEEAREALKSAKGLKFGDKPVRVSYVREASENWMEEFLKRKAEREALNSPSKKQKLDDESKTEEDEEDDDKLEEGDNEGDVEMVDDEETGEGEEEEGDEDEGEDEVEAEESEAEVVEDESEGEGDEEN